MLQYAYIFEQAGPFYKNALMFQDMWLSSDDSTKLVYTRFLLISNFPTGFGGENPHFLHFPIGLHSEGNDLGHKFLNRSLPSLVNYMNMPIHDLSEAETRMIISDQCNSI